MVENNVSIGERNWLGDFWVATRAGLVVEVQFGVPPPSRLSDDPLGVGVARQICEFLEGSRHEFQVPLDWTVMPTVHGDILRTLFETIRWGEVVTYGDLAAMAGHPGAARAAGTACRNNPFSVVVPAHRVIASGPRLGGFAGRPDLKQKLLLREGSGPFRA